ncbi:hypothetical protein ACQ86K_10600 [Mucilaginibacter sp. P19]|uniref:Uncharacterized protein n=1 Tax=Mucilaginibacter gossypii TaxID=551996 RepID=A0A1G7Z7B9_9SPHI|nr:hypothetical protein [Mucilaginibacter gossypii]SDH04598.1 hypothetical protein SAMN05192573_106166 [Mucilaginibacter gossypii]
MGAPKKPNTKKIENSDNDPDDDDEFDPKVKKKVVDDDDDDFDGPLDDDLGRGYESFDDEDEDDY